MIQFPYYKAYSIWADFPDYFQCKPFIAIAIILQLIVESVGNVVTEIFFFFQQKLLIHQKQRSWEQNALT